MGQLPGRYFMALERYLVAPWFVMQPAMGAGIAGARTPSPKATRLRNLGTHAVYGVGLYISAVALSTLFRGGWAM